LIQPGESKQAPNTNQPKPRLIRKRAELRLATALARNKAQVDASKK
jgi:hypothetical protein